MSYQFDRQKFKAVVHAIIARCPNAAEQLGAVKLHKTLYFVDMIHYLETGIPLTGAVYRRQPYGPMAEALGSTVRELREAGRIDVSSSDFFGYRKTRYISCSEPDLSKLKPAELELLDKVIEFVCVQNSAASISEISHSPAWQTVQPGEIMPYRSAHLFLADALSNEPAELDIADAEWAASVEGQIETGAARFLEPEAARTLRERILSRRRAESDPGR